MVDTWTAMETQNPPVYSPNISGQPRPAYRWQLASLNSAKLEPVPDLSESSVPTTQNHHSTYTDSAATTIGYTNVYDFTDAKTPPVTNIPSESQLQPPIANSTRPNNTKRKERELTELTLQGYTPNTTHRTAQETGRYREYAELPSRTLTKLPLRKSGLGIGPSTCGADAGYGLFASKDPTNKRQTTWVFAAGERIDIYRGHRLKPKKLKHWTTLSVQHQVRWSRSKYLWADAEDPNFVVDSNNPNSCYARYANDPLDD